MEKREIIDGVEYVTYYEGEEVNEEGYEQIEAKTTERDDSGKVIRVHMASEYFFVGKDLKAAVEKWGEEDVYIPYRKGAIVKFQNALRECLSKGTPEQLPFVKSNVTPGKSEASLVQKVASQSPEQQAELLRKLLESQGYNASQIDRILKR